MVQRACQANLINERYFPISHSILPVPSSLPPATTALDASGVCVSAPRTLMRGMPAGAVEPVRNRQEILDLTA
jgi:hypothetical protein